MILSIVYQDEVGWDRIFFYVPFLYFLPWYIASERDTKNQSQVRVISLFLWRTFIWRVVALAMACTNDVFSKEEPVEEKIWDKTDKSIGFTISKDMRWWRINVDWYKVNIPLKAKVGQKFVVSWEWYKSKKTWKRWNLYLVITKIE